MIIQAGDLAVELDTGTNKPGSILQRFDGAEWHDCTVNGECLVYPIEINSLPPGKFRMTDPNQNGA